jgi:transcriptional/translational regulatory protein YebC/TACO1
MFDRVGLVVYPLDKASADAMFEAALNAGAENVDQGTDGHHITCKPDDFATVRDALQKQFGDADRASLAWIPNLPVDVTDVETAQSVFDLIEALEDNDDVQTVTTNAHVVDDVMAELAS